MGSVGGIKLVRTVEKQDEVDGRLDTPLGTVLERDKRVSVGPAGYRDKQLIGYKIAAIENLAATNDQFATIDLTDNEIGALPGLPPLRRLKTFLLANNRITHVERDFAELTPYLESLILTNNKVCSVRDLACHKADTTLAWLHLYTSNPNSSITSL